MLARRMERLPADDHDLRRATPARSSGWPGSTSGRASSTTLRGRRIIAFVVREDARRRGIARALLAAVEAAARAAGCEHLHVTTAHRRADAHAAYTALGFSDTGLRFGKDLR